MSKTKQLIYIVVAIIVGIYLIGKLANPLIKKAHKIKAKQRKASFNKLEIGE